MKRLICLFAISAVFVGCATAPQLYSWYDYNETSYAYLKNATPESQQSLLKTYDKIIDKQSGTRAIVPPGVYADYGFMLMQENKKEEGKKMLMKEVELYPESKVFIEQIIRMTEK